MMKKWYIGRCNKTPLEKYEIKNTNLFNPQVASTDKYGNDFYIFFSFSLLTSKMKKEEEKNVLCDGDGSRSEERKRKFVLKCETTDNHGMMNE